MWKINLFQRCRCVFGCFTHSFQIEREIKCDMTPRQKKLYNALRQNISISQLSVSITDCGSLTHRFSNAQSESSLSHLMNLVMQFRKVKPCFPQQSCQLSRRFAITQKYFKGEKFGHHYTFLTEAIIHKIPAILLFIFPAYC